MSKRIQRGVLFRSLLEGFNSNKGFLNFLLHRNSRKAAIGAGVKDEFCTLETEQDRILGAGQYVEQKDRKAGGGCDIS